MELIYYILDDKHRVIPTNDIREWGKFFEKFDNRKVAQETLFNGLDVSTIFLGIDHDFSSGEIPILFESMVFDKNREELDCQRYTTWEQAVNGHKELVEKWSKEKKS